MVGSGQGKLSLPKVDDARVSKFFVGWGPIQSVKYRLPRVGTAAIHLAFFKPAGTKTLRIGPNPCGHLAEFDGKRAGVAKKMKVCTVQIASTKGWFAIRVPHARRA